MDGSSNALTALFPKSATCHDDNVMDCSSKCPSPTRVEGEKPSADDKSFFFSKVSISEA